MACEDLTAISLALLFHTSYAAAISNSQMKIIGITISVSLIFCMVKLSAPLFHQQEAILSFSYWIAILLVPLSSTVIIHILIIQLESAGNHMLPYIGATIITLFFINILVFYLYHKLIMEESAKYEKIILQNQNQAYENQTLLKEDFHRQLDKQLHDMKKQLAIIGDLAQEQENEKLQGYIKILIGDAASIKSGINSGNIIIDSIINSKLYTAILQNTQLDTDVLLSSTFEMNDVDLVTILGNLLDNALEACSHLPESDRKIQLHISLKHNTLIIRVQNTFDKSKLNILNNILHTNKKDQYHHGIGLKNVKSTVDKYGGMMKVIYDKHAAEVPSLFIVKIMISLPQSHEPAPNEL